MNQLNRCCKNCCSYRSGNKIGDKITSIGKTKSKEEEDKRQEIYIPADKRQQIIDVLKLFQTQYKNGKPKNYKRTRQNI